MSSRPALQPRTFSPPPKWIRAVSRHLGRFLDRGALWIVFLIASGFNLRLFQKIEEDTTAISNTTFVIAATLAALVFTWCQALPADDPDRPLVLYAGERFLEATFALLIASLLKYVARSIVPASVLPATPWVAEAVRSFLGVLSATFYSGALFPSFTAFRIVVPSLSARIRFAFEEAA